MLSSTKPAAPEAPERARLYGPAHGRGAGASFVQEHHDGSRDHHDRGQPAPRAGARTAEQPLLRGRTERAAEGGAGRPDLGGAGGGTLGRTFQATTRIEGSVRIGILLSPFATAVKIAPTAEGAADAAPSLLSARTVSDPDADLGSRPGRLTLPRLPIPTSSARRRRSRQTLPVLPLKNRARAGWRLVGGRYTRRSLSASPSQARRRRASP